MSEFCRRERCKGCSIDLLPDGRGSTAEALDTVVEGH